MHGQKQLVPLYVWPESAPWHPLAGAPARFLPRVGDLTLHRPATAIPQHSWNLSSVALDRVRPNIRHTADKPELQPNRISEKL